MRNTILFLLVLTTLCVIRCDKGDTMGVEDQSSVPDVGTFIILPHGVVTSPPQEVHLFCNVVDTSRAAVDFLTVDRFLIKENGTFIDPDKAALHARKRDTFDYCLNTILLLDVSTDVSLDDLKEAVREFVDSVNPMQSIAIYVFSGTLNMVQDFSQNTGELIGAVDGITTGSEERNLYGAIWQGFNLLENEIYSLGIVQQGNLVVFTAGEDTQNEKTREEVIYTSRFVNVYTIGLGSDLDRDFLSQTGNRGCFLISDTSQLAEAFTETQAAITGFADSFYWISYQSAARGTGTQEVEMSISANAYDGTGSTMKNTFDASQFEDIETGITVNWTSEEPSGVDTLIIGINVFRTVKALSRGGDALPVYEWSSADPGIMTVEPIAAGFSEAVLLAGDEGNTLLIVKDTANGFSDTVAVQTVLSYNGFVVREWWSGVSGTSINSLTSDPRFPDFPSGRQYISPMDGPQNFGDNYGSCLKGFIHPDISGTYSFWIASDDASQLFLSTNENPEQKALIASVDSWTNYQAYDSYPSQHSADIELEAGMTYYIEALHKEGTGGDNLSVAWQGPGIDRSLIPSQNLSAWLGD